jgi:hypothetical protein
MEWRCAGKQVLSPSGCLRCNFAQAVEVKKGRHHFEVQAIDQAENVGSPATDTWKKKR